MSDIDLTKPVLELAQDARARQKKRSFVWRAEDCLRIIEKTKKLLSKQEAVLERLGAEDDSVIEELDKLQEEIYLKLRNNTDSCDKGPVSSPGQSHDVLECL